MHRKNYPLKKLMPIIANIIKKSVQTIITFVIAGIDDKSALTTNLRPSFLLMTLNGRNALSALNALSDLRALPPAVDPETKIPKSIIEATTTMKSRKFQAERM